MSPESPLQRISRYRAPRVFNTRTLSCLQAPLRRGGASGLMVSDWAITRPALAGQTGSCEHSSSMALMEWEFNEGPDNDGTFMATGKVIEQLRRHLARGEIDDAVSLYESCAQETVGKELWNEFTAASNTMKKAIANLFYRSRDYERAAKACETLGEWPAAAKAHAAAYNFEAAGECFLKKEDRLQAAQMFEKAGQARRAAEMYYEAKRMPEAAAALEKAGDLLGASQIYIRIGEDNRAAQALSQVQSNDRRFIQAVGLLSEVLVRLGRRDLALQRLAAVLNPGQPIRDKWTAELGYRLGRLLASEGNPDQARQAFQMVQAFDPKFRDVSDQIGRLVQGQKPVTWPGVPVAQITGRPETPPSARATQEIPAVSRKVPITTGTPLPHASPTGTPLPRVTPSQTDPFAALDGDPFSSGSYIAAQPPANTAQTIPVGYVQRMAGYEYLKELSLFKELSLEEMRSFYTICQQVQFPAGEVIIEQGHPGTGLVIVTKGRLQVSKIEHGGQETNLATLGPGQYVGEMSLVDDVPTSARVKTLDEVQALRIAKERFQQFMFENDRIALRVYRSFVQTLSERLRAQNAKR